MSQTTLKQASEVLKLVSQKDLDRDRFQSLLESGLLSDLLSADPARVDRDAFIASLTAKGIIAPQAPKHPEPVITPIAFPRDYKRTLVQMRDAMRLDGYVEKLVNDENFPFEVRDGDRQFVTVWFNREVGDDEDPAKSELLTEISKLGLVSEGPPELFAVGEHHPKLQLEFPIVARRQVWRLPGGGLVCPVLSGHGARRDLHLSDVRSRWSRTFRFLCSRPK